MWMTGIVREVKRQLRDVYGVKPDRTENDEPCFDDIPDGVYPMTIDSEEEDIAVIDNKFYFLKRVVPKTEQPIKIAVEKPIVAEVVLGDTVYLEFTVGCNISEVMAIIWSIAIARSKRVKAVVNQVELIVDARSW